MPTRLNQPNRDILIFVPAQATIWRSGDVVRGTVRVKVTSRPQRVTIVFRGRMKCAITRSNGNTTSTTYREKPEFFSHVLELFSSSTAGQSYDIVTQGVTEDDRAELPFEFTWPERTEIAPGSQWLTSPPSCLFEHQPGGQLPPTYHRVSQQVEYFLEARLFTRGRNNPSQEVRCPLKYQPCPLIPDPIPPIPRVRTMYDSRGIIARTHRLHPEYDPNEGWRAKLKHSWNKDKDTTPYAKYCVSVSCPSVITAGQPVVLTLSLDHLERSKDIPDPPPVHLRRISVRLTSKLHVRIPMHSFFSSSDMNDTHSDKCLLLDKSFNTGDGLPMYDGMTATTRQFPVQITPAFQTYGLALVHTLKVELWGECAREKFRFTPIQGSIRVVAATNHPQLEDLPPPPKGLEGEAPPSVDEDIAPPPYQVLGKI